jgi:acyl carrier protein
MPHHIEMIVSRPMTERDILARLTTIFQDLFDDPSLIVGERTTAEDVEGWDSVNHVLLVVEVERRFGVKFRTAEIETLRNVGDLVGLIAKRSAGTT